jgi:pimeloyl-ACP methyl ester carboxylesterase
MQLTRPEPAAPAGLRDYYTQRLQWSRAGSGGVQYTSVEVPLDYGDPAGERITIAVSRIMATGSQRRGILLSVQGDPGGGSGQGCELVRVFQRAGLTEAYDLIGFDPRGTGASTPLLAETVIPRSTFDSRPPDSAFPLIAEDMRRREDACRRGGGRLRPHISTRNTARDMDVIRGALGERKISFVGYAYGSYAGAVYGTMFPAHLDRSVLDSCVHPDWTWRQVFLGQATAIRKNVDRWAAWAGQRHTTFGLGTDGPQVLAAVEDVAGGLAAAGDSGTFLRTLLDGMMGTQTADRSEWAGLAEMVGQLQAATRGHDMEKAAALLAGQRTWRPQDSEGELRNAALEAVTLETEWPDDLEVYYRDMREFRKNCPYGYGVLRAAPWVGAFRTFTAPEKPARLERAGYPVGLVVHADGNQMDPFEGGAAMAQRLGHRLVTIADSGEHEVYALAGNHGVDEVVGRYLIDGVLPLHDTVCPGRVSRPDIPPDSPRS